MINYLLLKNNKSEWVIDKKTVNLAEQTIMILKNAQYINKKNIINYIFLFKDVLLKIKMIKFF